jgi:hypothetical protein
MNATETTRVEIDDRIREQPEFLRAVGQATEYVLEESKGIAPPSAIRWRFAPHEADAIELTMTEPSELGGGFASRTFPVRYLLDPVSRDTMALRTFGDLLRKRSQRNLERIDALIRKIDFDEYVRAYVATVKNKSSESED